MSNMANWASASLPGRKGQGNTPGAKPFQPKWDKGHKAKKAATLVTQAEEQMAIKLKPMKAWDNKLKIPSLLPPVVLETEFAGSSDLVTGEHSPPPHGRIPE